MSPRWQATAKMKMNGASINFKPTEFIAHFNSKSSV